MLFIIVLFTWVQWRGTVWNFLQTLLEMAVYCSRALPQINSMEVKVLLKISAKSLPCGWMWFKLKKKLIIFKLKFGYLIVQVSIVTNLGWIGFCCYSCSWLFTELEVNELWMRRCYTFTYLKWNKDMNAVFI